MREFVIGSRGSDLALWQSNFVKNELEKRFPDARFEIRIIKTKGDKILDTALSKIGDKGLFTKEIEIALLKGEIDLAVHSLKDLPTAEPEGLKITAFSAREMPNDVLISKKYKSIDELPKGAKIATGSLRRKSQLLNYRPDLEIHEIRGNVPTRIEKFFKSDLDALILAFAGVHRLGLDNLISQIIPTEILLPAVGQGIIAVESRCDDLEMASMLEKINNKTSEACARAERAFMRTLQGGCQVPVGALATLENDTLTLQGFIGSHDGKRFLREKMSAKVIEAENLGMSLARKCLEKGGSEILAEIRKESKANSQK
ncbi:MAG: hydroxymethylbilane synthase [Acidobacteria bacterium]|jgi:hydroxymethylbilane synthase|nr:MAG: hydroxymethylbilane synthase [Acidobacteriota bacterium]GIU81263.1 MAG: porphobilinogen deaminase [Pyrinomonadaceae bacterium]